MILPPVAAAYAGTFQILDRTEVDLRVTGQSSQGPSAGFDVTTQPLARVAVHDRRTEYSLSYAPSITATFVDTAPQPPLVLHFVNATAAWHDRELRVALSEAASYGEMNSGLLLEAPTATPAGPAVNPGTGAGASGQPPPLRAVPPPVTIRFGSSTTDLSVGERLGRGWTLSSVVGYSVSGQLDSVPAGSTPVIPEQYGPHASVSAAHRLSRRDDLITTAHAERTDSSRVAPQVCAQPGASVTTMTTCAPQAEQAQLTEALRHRLSPTASISVDAGIGAALTRTDPSLPWQQAIYPIAGATLTDNAARGMSISLALSASPAVDAYTGLVDEWGVATFTLNDRATRMVTLTANTSVAQTIPLYDATFVATMVSAGVATTLHLDRLVDLAVGEQGFWQNLKAFGGFFSAFTFVALTVRAPVLRF